MQFVSEQYNDQIMVCFVNLDVTISLMDGTPVISMCLGSIPSPFQKFFAWLLINWIIIFRQDGSLWSRTDLGGRTIKESDLHKRISKGLVICHLAEANVSSQDFLNFKVSMCQNQNWVGGGELIIYKEPFSKCLGVLWYLLKSMSFHSVGILVLLLSIWKGRGPYCALGWVAVGVSAKITRRCLLLPRFRAMFVFCWIDPYWKQSLAWRRLFLTSRL